MYELKKNIGKVLDESICSDRALVLWKKNLPVRGLTKVEEHCTKGWDEPEAGDGTRERDS